MERSQRTLIETRAGELLLLIVSIPVVVLLGLGYGLLADGLTKGREPWLTLCLAVGLGITVFGLGVLIGVPLTWSPNVVP